MAKARVVLTRSISHEARGRMFKKGEPQIIDNDSDIAYYKAQPEFSVTPLKPVKATKPKPAPEPEETDDEDDDEGGDEEELTEERLNKMTKTELIKLASGEPFNLSLDNEMKKAEMVDAILTGASLKD